MNTCTENRYKGLNPTFQAVYEECGGEMVKVGDWPNPDLGINMYNVLYQCAVCRAIKLI